MGRIADTAKSILPITWDALANDERVGDSALTIRDEYVQSLIFGDVVEDDDQDDLENIVVEYAAKTLALQVIDMGIDFWMIESETETTQSPVEVVSYPERLDHLKELKKSLMAELAALEPLVTPLIPNIFDRLSGQRPLISSFDDEMLTPNPQDFGPSYAPPEV